MKKALLITCLIFASLFANAQSYNPYVNQGIVSPAPLSPVEFNGTGLLSFNVGNTGSTPLPLVANQEMGLIITLSNGIPDNVDPLLAMGGSWLGFFDWTYDAGITTYTGIQNQEIPGSDSGDITIAYRVTTNTPIGGISNGFNVNLQPPPYTNGINTTNDDAVSSYTYVLATDYGDAPASYGEASHDINIYKTSGLYTQYIHFGSSVDPEVANQDSPNADGDDTNDTDGDAILLEDDEDGVTFPSLILGTTVDIPVEITVNDNGGFGFLIAWIDWNGDGDFDDTGENIIPLQFIPSVSTGTINYSVTVPGDAITTNPTFARFRLSASGVPAATGTNASGEVEDYEISISAAADVSVVKTVETSPVVSGEELIYRLVVNNAGPSAALNVELTDLLANLPFPSPEFATTLAGPWSAWTGSVAIGTMAPSTTETYYIRGTLAVDQCTPVSNTATVTTTTTDLNLTNNESSVLNTTVLDQTDPLISCAADVAVNVDTDECFATVTLTDPTTSDDCGILSLTNNAPATYPVGTTTVTWIVTDNNGNTATCDQDVVVTDNVDPLISCAADVAVNVDTDECFATVTLTDPTTSDDCGILSLTNNAPATYPVGTTTVTWIVTDNNGNTATCDQDVVVTDNVDPLISCAADVAVNVDTDECFATVTLTDPTTSDDCGILSLTNNAPATYPVGTTTVTWIVTDNNGNTATCDQDVVVTDNVDPLISCAADVAVNVDTDECFATVTLTDPTTSDDCGILSLTNNAPATYPVGTTTVTWIVTDNNGNTATCDQDVVVTDNVDPLISCAADVAVNVDTDECFATVTLTDPTTSDDCGILSLTNNAPATYPVGTTTVTWIVTDNNGNTATCDQDVVVTDNVDPLISCAADVAVNVDTDECFATVTLTDPTTSDDCGILSLTNNAPATYPVGTTTVTWIVTDNNGNTATCDQDVVVTDNVDPLISCAADVAVNVDTDECFATVTLTDPTTSDDCGILSLTNNAPATYPVGTTTVTWIVTDNNGNTATCDQDVVVTDNVDPLISCAADVAVNVDTDECFATVTLTDPTTSDDCGILSLTNNAPATYPVGTTTVTWIVTDNNGNTATCDQDVVVTDNVDPLISCAADVAVNVDTDECFATVTLTDPTTSDDCGILSLTNNAPATYPVGTTTVTWIVTDNNGNTATCDQDVVVTDNVDPLISCAADVAVNVDTDECFATVTLTDPTTSDDCGILSLTNNAPATYPVGTTTVTWIVTDNNGNTATCDQDVVVTDNVDPLISCAADVAVNVDTDECFATVTLTDPTTSDDCGILSLTNNAPATYPVGTTTVTWIVTDNNGNTATCDQDVVVTDNVDPLISCAADVAVNVDTDECFATVTLTDPTTSDDCGILSLTNNAPATYPVGTTTVTWIVTDNNGNTATCDQDVVVTDNVDPLISCAADVAVNVDTDECFATVTLTDPTTSDDCGILSLTNNAPATYPVGTTTVTWIVTDNNGNTATCDQDVVVTDNVDPLISCAADVAVNVDTDECFATVTLTDPTTSDDCGILSLTNNAPATYPVGTTTVTWIVTDNNGNTATCDQDVVVTDNVDPLISCAADVAVNVDTDECFATVTLTDPTTSDDCGILSLTNNAPATYPVGTTTVTWIVTDNNGNTATCDQDVVVTDNVDPLISCAADVAVNVDTDECFATVTLTDPTTSDDCGILSLTNNAPATYPVGTTTVTWIVTDNNGNTATCDQDVVVTDNVDPLISCAADVAVNVDTDECFATVTLTDPTTSDDCGILSLTNNAPATYPVGTTTVTWIVTDNNGNTATCDQDVVVTDNVDPLISCAADVAVNVDTDECFATVTLTDPTTSDDCGILSLTNNAPATYPVGTTTVTWIVTDNNGNTATCDQDVVVTDNVDPLISCAADVAVNVDTDECFATVTLTDPTTSDDCGILSLTNNAPATYPVGTTTVTWIVTDNNGNTATCDQDVVVTDNVDPLISCAADVAVNVDTDECFATVTLTDPTTSDDCGILSLTNNAPATYPVGTTTVTWIVTDNNGNTATCDQDVVVTDNVDPLISCAADVAVNVDTDECFATVTLTDPTTSDDCGILSLTNNAPATYPVGTTTVTWIVTDNNGNTATCDQDVVVTDNVDPLISCAADVAVNVDTDECFATVTLTDPTTSDDCGILSLTNNAPATYPVGTTTVTWIVTDNNGNTATCDQDVVVTDNVDPLISCAADVAVNVDTDECFATVTLTDPTTSDDCGILSLTNNAPATYPVGTTTVTWIVTDNNGNTATCDQDVVVTDNVDPLISCAADVAVNVDTDECFATVTLTDPTTSDDCGILSLTNNAPATYPVGTTTVTWIVTDNNGNTATCDQDVVVTDNVDPLISCAADVAVNVDTDECFATVTLTDPTTSDDCGILSLTNNAPATYPVGTTTVTWIVTDNNGNTATCDQDVVVTDNVDPLISCAADVAVNVDTDECFATVTLTDPTTSDDCGILSLTNNAPATYPVGTTTVTWIVTDNNGNTATCDQDVVVTTPSISGTVYDDADATINALIDGTPIQTSGTDQLYVNLVSGGLVVGVVPVNGDGTYTLDCNNGLAINTTYDVVLSTTAGTINSAPVVTLTNNWVNTAEGSGTGDGTPDGSFTVNVGTTDISGVDLGIEQLPETDPASETYVNPGGTNTVTVPTLTGSDPEDGAYGSGSTLVIKTLPTNGTLYYNGTPVTGGQTITNYNPTLLTFDPDDGAIIETFTYAFVDAAGNEDPSPATATLTFTELTISGNVYDDANGLLGTPINTVDGIGTNVSDNVYVNLVDDNDDVLVSVLVNPDGTYEFTSADGVEQNTTFNIILTATVQTEGDALTVASLPSNWVSTGENIGTGPGNDGLANSILSVAVVTTSVSDANLGIEQLPNGADYIATSVTNPGGTTTVPVPSEAFTGTDPEDGTYPVGLLGMKITLYPAINGILYYDGVEVSAETVIDSFDSALLSVDPDHGTINVSIDYAVWDAANQFDPEPNTVTLPFNDLTISGTVFNDMDRLEDLTVDGTGTNAGGIYANLTDPITNVVIASVAVNPDGTYSFGTIDGVLAEANYDVILTEAFSLPGTSLSDATLPDFWISTGENIGIGTGDDGVIDGKLNVSTTTTGVNNVNFGIVQVPDITPIITAVPNVMLGETNFYITVRVTELNLTNTNGLITVRVPKDTRWILDGPYDSGLTTLGVTPLNNSDWAYSDDGTSHIFTTTSVISAGGFSYFGFNAIWSAGATEGEFTITSQIDSFSGGEDRIDNNVDAEQLDYFIE